MVKKKRYRKNTVFGVLEGDREALLLKHFKELFYDRSKVSMLENLCRGGEPNDFVNLAIRESFNRDVSFVWMDEDKDINFDTRKKLIAHWGVKDENLLTCPLGQLQNQYNSKNKNPVLIISQPVCVEGFILELLGYKCELFHLSKRTQQIRRNKDTLHGIMNAADEVDFYQDKFSKDFLEVKCHSAKELELLISIIRGDLKK